LVRVLVDRAESTIEAREIPVTGLQQCHLGEILFDDCEVPLANKLGSAGDAAKILTLTWLANRPIIGLVAVHCAQAAFESAKAFAADRRQFGGRLAGYQLIQQR